MKRTMSIRKGLVFCLVLMGLMISGVHSANAEESLANQVKAAMKVLQEKSMKLGAPSAEGTALSFGTTKMNGNYALVDEIKDQFKCTATFFVKKSDSYIRVATNVIKDDGSRAVGTPLDPKGVAIAKIAKGEPYYGLADILGKQYETGYEPIRNAAGEVVGITYIGFPVK